MKLDCIQTVQERQLKDVLKKKIFQFSVNKS